MTTAGAAAGARSHANVRTKGSHAIYRHPDGRTTVIPLHGTVKRGTLSSIIRQAGLTTAKFLALL